MEIDYNEVFGLGENSPDTAAPGTDTDAGEAGKQGEKERESADPTDKSENSGADTGEAGEGADEEDTGEQEAESKGQTKEERARFAAARRKEELEAAVARARQETQEASQKQWKEFFERAGLRDPLNGNKPITTLEEFNAYKERYDQEQLQKSLKTGAITQDVLEKVISNSPIIKKAQTVIERAEAEERKTRDAQAQAKIDAEIAEIGKLDPSVKTMDDLLKIDRFTEFNELVKRGNTFLDAYKLANFDRLTQSAQAAARQQALNGANSKDHLRQTAARGQGAVTVPDDIKAQYREFMPGATDAEIQAHYNKYLSAQKK